MKGRLSAATLLLLSLLSGAAACGEPITEADDAGHTITLGSPATRIVSLAPNITELLFYIGAGASIVGADEYSDYPEAAKAIPRVNNYSTANYELILSLAPDLVLGWQSGNGQIPGRVRALGFPVFEIEPRRLEDIPALFLRLGRLVGREAQSQPLAADFTRRLEVLQQRQRGKAPVRVFYQIWNEPLMTLNDSHIVSDVIALCGGVNVFGSAVPLVPYVSIEAVLQADPQVIIASGSDDGNPAWMEMWKAWPAISAVREDHVFSIPPDLMQRHSVRILDGAEQLCGFLDRARRAAAATAAPAGA
jgi:iron complex transport system substrate-binding protein